MYTTLRNIPKQTNNTVVFLYLIILYTPWLIKVEPTCTCMHQEDEEVDYSPVMAYINIYCATDDMQKFVEIGRESQHIHTQQKFLLLLLLLFQWILIWLE